MRIIPKTAAPNQANKEGISLLFNTFRVGYEVNTQLGRNNAAQPATRPLTTSRCSSPARCPALRLNHVKTMRLRPICLALYRLSSACLSILSGRDVTRCHDLQTLYLQHACQPRTIVMVFYAVKAGASVMTTKVVEVRRKRPLPNRFRNSAMHCTYCPAGKYRDHVVAD